MKKIIITGGSGFIGTNLVKFILKNKQEYHITNIDIKSPKLESQKTHWINCDINDFEALRLKVNKIKPDYIIHLAAEADVKYTKLSDFKTNIEGVENICKIVNESDSIKRIIFTSTQYVNQLHGQPIKDDEYYPFTMYGKSKVEGEKIIRNFGLNKIWTIIRPTNVYGPYNEVYVNGLFKVIQNGYYFHPNINVMRSYGYVGTVVEQITKIIKVESNLVNTKTFYVGDEPIQLLDFVTEIHKYLGKEKVKKIPIWVFRFAAYLGEIAKKTNVPFPMNKTRYINMVTPNPIDMEKTFNILGKGSLSFNDRIKRTISWYLSKTKLKEV